MANVRDLNQWFPIGGPRVDVSVVIDHSSKATGTRVTTGGHVLKG